MVSIPFKQVQQKQASESSPDQSSAEAPNIMNSSSVNSPVVSPVEPPSPVRHSSDHSLETGSQPLRGVDDFKWIFVTKLHPSTSEADIVNHIDAKLKIGAQKIVCRKLVKRDVDLSNVDFISFKVLVKSPNFLDVLGKSFWPKEIQARLFQANRSAFFRMARRRRLGSPRMNPEV